MAWTSYTTRWLDSRISSDALYRERGKWISDRLTDLGWGKTADTGQIDWATTTRPGAPTSNTKGGYEIRVSSGAGTDIYLKITYGCGYGSGVCIGIWIATGTGSDGAGTLTGSLTTERQVGTAFGSGSPYESTWYMSGDADNFVFGGTHEQTYANGCIFGVQRTCDASGVDTATGWFKYGIGYSGTGAYSSCQMVNFSTGAKSGDVPGFGCTYVPRELKTTSAPIIFLPLLAQDGSTYAALRDVIAQAGGSLFATNDLYHYGGNRKFVSTFAGTNSALWGFTSPFSYYAGPRIA